MEVCFYCYRPLKLEVETPIKMDKGWKSIPQLTLIEDDIKVKFFFDSYQDIKRLLEDALMQVNEILQQVGESGV